jgi:two-component system, NarL family, nitrate/nitrite response regulator NarL
MTAPIRIAVVDDHPLFREGVARCLRDMHFDIVAQGSSKEDAVRIAEQQRPDIILMDISMPGGGLNAIGQILERRPEQNIVMLTVSELTDDVTQALKSGAKGYVLKGVGYQVLAQVLRTVARGETYLSPTLSARVVSDLSQRSTAPVARSLVDELNPRQKEILTLVASGLSNKRIALQLGVQEKTVKHHMTRIMAKLNASNRTEAAMALRDATKAR